MSRNHPLFIVPVLLALFGGEKTPTLEKPPTPLVKKESSPKKQVIKNSSNNQKPSRAITPRKDRRPNIIFILSDDQDTASLRAMPRLRNSFPLQFQNHIITDPVCCPSRETFMTGQYAHNHGVRSNSRQPGLLPGREWGGWWAAGSRKENIGRWLRRSGYKTALIGKYLNGFDARKPPPLGWDDTFLALDDKKKGYFNYRMLDNGTLKNYGEKATEYSTSVMTDRAIENLKKSNRLGSPLFLFLSYNTPHNGSTSARQPHLDPEPHPRDRNSLRGQIPRVFADANFDHKDPLKPNYMNFAKKISPKRKVNLQRRMRSRWQSVYSMDREIARLVRAVRKTGQINNTYFFFTTDNGFFLGDHRLVGKFLPYDEATRFPLLVKGPGIQGGVREDLVANIDIVPTVLDIADADAPRDHIIDGKSMLSLIRGEEDLWRDEVVIETFPTVNYDEEKGPHQPYVAIRGRNDVFIRYQKQGLWPTRWNGEEEYYDLREDPHQLSNAIKTPRYQERIQDLRNKSDLWRNCAGKECP